MAKGIGIIGYGGFGEFIHKAWNGLDEAHVVAACDADPARNPGGDAAFYQDADSLLADPNVEIVSVATPPSSHKDLAIKAMRAGKHVLVEKPIALTEADALEIKQAAEETDRIASVNFVLRYNRIVEALREVARSEVFGKLRRVDLRNYAMQDQTPEGHWFWNPEISGRILLEHGVHFFDLASWVIDAKASDAWSLGVERKPGMEDRVFAAVRYGNDVVGTFWHSFTRPRLLETTTFHFDFDLGEIDMIGWIPLELRLWGWTDSTGLDAVKGLGDGLELRADKLGPTKAHSSEFFYDVSYLVDAVVTLEDSKTDIYAQCLRHIMADMVAAIDNPAHKMRVTLDDALEAVRVAEKATNFAHPK